MNSHFGILDVCGFPKDNFWYYKAWWGAKPSLHLLPHWNWKVGQQVEVWVQSNAEEVEIFVNGESQGRKPMPKFEHVAWTIPYKPGTLSAKGYVKGEVVSEDKVETTGPAFQIKLEPDATEMSADGEDLVPVAVSILDKEGRVVPLSDNEVSFKVEGPGMIAGVGNGDPSSHEPDKATKRQAFNGLCAVYLGAGEKAGALILKAEAGGLQGASVTIKSTTP